MGAFLLLRTVMAMYNSGILPVGARSTAIAILLRCVPWPGRPIARVWLSVATMGQSRSGSYRDQLLTSPAQAIASGSLSKKAKLPKRPRVETMRAKRRIKDQHSLHPARLLAPYFLLMTW